MHSLRPIHNRLRRLLGLGRAEFFDTAVDRWEICPADEVEIAPGIWLPDQVEHIARTEFGGLPDILAQMQGDPAERTPPTMGYRFRDVDFVDGVLHARGAERHLRQRRHSGPTYPRPRDSLSGALYESWIGNRWFGNWLLNDCLAYRLAEAAGAPVTSAPARGGHIARYETLLGMAPRRIGEVHFDELILFDDLHNNSHRRARAQENRARILKDRALKPLPGVFIFRGASGDARILVNEAEIAERLEVEYGFRTLYVDRHDADQMAEAAGAARLVVGVEGSQLAHGVIAMPAGGTLLTLQPADRVTTSLKLLTDCWQQRYAMVVGSGTAGGYRVEWDQIRRTLDLIAAAEP
ncbi:glycosyltransferase family 61 protein [Paracoccus sp. TOH]|uniref:glycosyltransferase family 61 protein n=1 Tax=Paracoccus sp. TOH TaxID=1263728 RepID=UPI0025B201EB|nr:glycosyltransferase family 61 protein [Paracoccus sp. TOH]WJS85726.1 glycosyltransferase family 61 protein [Paracoccus sp. TOH]